MIPISTKHNSYHKNRKEMEIYTPEGVCHFLHEIISPHIEKNKSILDPAVGKGNLLNPWKGEYNLVGYDINDVEGRDNDIDFIHSSFLEEKIAYPDVGLALINPPFNNTKENDKFLRSIHRGRALMSELFIDKCFELYGQKLPLVMISPMGLLFNQRINSTRWKHFRDDLSEAQITSIIPLPLDIFDNVKFHVGIYIWNIPQLKPFYWLPDYATKRTLDFK